MRNITKPEARNTRSRDSVLKVDVVIFNHYYRKTFENTHSGIVMSCMMYKLM